MEVPSGTNPEPLLVFRLLLAVFNLGLRVVLAALHDDPGFGLRAKVGAFKIEAPPEWRTNRARFLKPEELLNESGTGPYKISSDPFPLIAARNQKLVKQGKALPVYAADQEGSLFRESTPGINLLRVNDETYWKRLYEVGCLPAGGVTSPYLYFGMAGTTFATHVEVWFVVSKDYRPQVLDLADRVLSQAEKNGCHVPLRHKHVILPPTLLTANNIPFTVLIQREGDYVFTEPGSFHCGFNVGFNIAEAVNYATEEWLEEGIRVFGGYYDSEAPMNTDYGELCICDYRYSLAPNVRFTKFPAATVCKIFHRRQRMFCAMKRYTDTCVDLLRAGGHEPPSVDLITEALKSVRITGPGAEPNPLREPLVFGCRPASNAGESPAAEARLTPTGREMCRTLPCCRKCGKSFSRQQARHAHEKHCSEVGHVSRTEASSAPLFSSGVAGSSSTALVEGESPSSTASLGGTSPMEACLRPEVIASRETRRRRADFSSSPSLSSSDSTFPSPPASKKPQKSSARRRNPEGDSCANTSTDRRENYEHVSSARDGDERSFPVMFQQAVASFAGVVESLKSAVAAVPNRPVVGVQKLPATPSMASTLSDTSASAARRAGPDARQLYPCIYCGKRLSGKSRMRHQYSHERDYQCPLCGQSHTKSENREHHYAAFHKGVSPPSSLAFVPKNPSVGGVAAAE
ncbi:hypothetical protein AAVH_22449 [Aphelenchoides avenae]|nr:hypothetical protein AAVH_22449 [Aphelenchus avenae]